MVPSNDAESVVVDFFVKAGSRYETLKENGISHFLEHFLFKGTQKYPSALAISELVDAIGGEMNANTGKEHTQYYIKAHKKYLPLLFEVLTDMIQAPLFDPSELEREKGVIMEEINMYKDTPMVEVQNILEELMWPKQALGRDIAGTKQTVTKFTTGMFRDYMGRFYTTSNMIVGISGNFDQKKLDGLVAKHWRDIKNKRADSWSKAITKQSQSRLKVQFKDTEQAHLALGFKGLAHEDKANPAASILAAILGGGMSSRLFMEVRERRGLAYYVKAGNGNYRDTGNFEVRSGVQVDKIEAAIQVILAELKRIASEPVPDKELAKAKEYLKGKTTLALEDNQARLDWYMDEVAFANKVKSPKDYFKLIDKVSITDVQKLAQKLFNPKQMSLAVIGPYKNQKSFEKLLH